MPQMAKLRVDPRMEHFHAPEAKPHSVAPPGKKVEE